MKKWFVLATIVGTFSSFTNSTLAFSAEFLPRAIMKTDDFFTHHILVAEKSTHLLHLYEHSEQGPKLIKSYPMATGKMTGDKKSEGDFKTPEGIYYFTRFMNHDELIKQSGPLAQIYGAGAFVMDYPNALDKINHKSGSGIWLHSTNDETRIDKGLDSRGCVVTANKELIDISKYIELNKTPIIVTQELAYLNETTFKKEKDELMNVFNSWLDAWRNKDIDKYASFYHPELFSDGKRRHNEFKSYKRMIFSNPGKPSIEVDKISILNHKGYAVINFIQKYTFTSINDIGKKTLYLVKDDNYNWRIVNEDWSKKGLEELDKKVSFQPTFRFFNEEILKKY